MKRTEIYKIEKFKFEPEKGKIYVLKRTEILNDNSEFMRNWGSTHVWECQKLHELYKYIKDQTWENMQEWLENNYKKIKREEKLKRILNDTKESNLYRSR